MHEVITDEGILEELWRMEVKSYNSEFRPVTINTSLAF